ncbi:MAG TPA: hypothetical protein VJZ73_18715 [Methylomirabilota bacterium]|nr:hypothetical protein [Methylomirabilota bacterium]
MDSDRDRMRILSTRLLDLHGVLLDRERRAYEEEHGSVASRELLHLLLHDRRFAWLRSLSSMIANIDAVVDADEPIAPESARAAFREAYRLLKSDDGGDFRDKYHLALQDSPDVIMAHAAVSRVLADADPTKR